jgi:hypothetical protein
MWLGAGKTATETPAQPRTVLNKPVTSGRKIRTCWSLRRVISLEESSTGTEGPALGGGNHRGPPMPACTDLVSRQVPTAKYRQKGAEIMPMLPPRRWPARYKEPTCQLPAPGPFPWMQPPRDVIVIFVVVLVVIAWLLAHGYSVNTALGAVAGAGAFTAAIASRLPATQPSDN